MLTPDYFPLDESNSGPQRFAMAVEDFMDYVDGSLSEGSEQPGQLNSLMYFYNLLTEQFDVLEEKARYLEDETDMELEGNLYKIGMDSFPALRFCDEFVRYTELAFIVLLEKGLLKPEEISDFERIVIRQRKVDAGQEPKAAIFAKRINTALTDITSIPKYTRMFKEIIVHAIDQSLSRTKYYEDRTIAEEEIAAYSQKLETWYKTNIRQFGFELN